LIIRPAQRLARIAALICGVALSAPAAAQGTATLEAERNAVYAQLLRAPADRALMAEYVRLSLALRDYESAAATLERLVFLEPGNTTALLELARAYIGVGAFDLANVHIATVLASGAPPEQIAEAAALQRLTARDGSDSRLSGRVTFGASWEGNDRPGATGSLSFAWRVDMGGPHAHDWLTQFGLSGYTDDIEAGQDRGFLRLRTGPEFRITGERFGPRLQPYLQFTGVRDTDEGDSNDLVFGLAYQNPHSATWTSFADASIGLSQDPASGVDNEIYDISLGTTFRPTGRTSLRLTFLYSDQEGPVEDREMRGARLDVTQQVASPLSGDARDWLLGGHVSRDHTDITSGRTTREEDSVGYGVFLRAYVSDRAFFEARASRVDRASSLAVFDSEETVGSLQFGWEL